MLFSLVKRVLQITPTKFFNLNTKSKTKSSSSHSLLIIIFYFLSYYIVLSHHYYLSLCVYDVSFSHSFSYLFSFILFLTSLIWNVRIYISFVTFYFLSHLVLYRPYFILFSLLKSLPIYSFFSQFFFSSSQHGPLHT